VGQSASGAWWLIDPKGQSFFSVGVDVVNYGGDSTAAGTSTTTINVNVNINVNDLSPSLFFLLVRPVINARTHTHTHNQGWLRTTML
jgi:hypothetical protein